ncbi:hypothetical protein DP939_27125 [Spongiactinospora rosea]|uniref:Uncharacterized protein n=1 Tax=Spongiactinospora rosea TaxID=2248750 RepID=A0A366LTA5_9ACTN|nr:hypothetical protein [Spongiactinospora rosea]RBQ17151.1 hypothetical protein DP939_27125 [Spongiactinospora rosea]
MQVGGKVWHMYLPDEPRVSEVAEWERRAARRAATGYIVTPNVFGHPVDQVCPYCKVKVVMTPMEKTL